MKNTPMVSVIVPNYNHAPYLQQRLESILNQTWQSLELIILDDASTDNSREIIEGYRNHPKVAAIVYNTQNSGSVFRQWAKGFELAKGTYIWIAESDDWSKPLFLETLITALEQNQSAVVAFCQTQCVDAQEKLLWETYHKGAPVLLSGMHFVRQYMVTRNAVVNASMAVFCSTAIKYISDSYMQFRYCGDWMFWIELFKVGDVFVSDKVLNFFRKHATDVTGKSVAQGIDIIEHLSILDMLRKNGIISLHEFRVVLYNLYTKFVRDSARYATVDASKITACFNSYVGSVIRFRLLNFKYMCRKWILQKKDRLNAKA